MKKTTLWLLCTSNLLLSSLAIGYTINCPEANSLILTKQHNAPAWNEWRASGNAIVKFSKKPDQTIAMSGESTLQTATELFWASYYPGDDFNDLICNYLGKTQQGKTDDLVMTEINATHLLDNCRFKQGDFYECEGNSKHCELVCS